MIYHLDLPDLPYITPNKRVHWSVRSRSNAAWRHATTVLARQAGLPRGAGRIAVALDYWPQDRRRRDPDNLVSGVLKPCVDGLVDAGVIADDTAAEVVRQMPTIHAPDGGRRRRWVLTVEILEETTCP